MCPDFLKTNVDFGKNFIRGAARILVADPNVKPFPTRLSDMIRLVTASQDEVQTLTITGAPTGGTFTITYKGYTTAPIAFDATAATVQAALELLPSIGTANVVCAGGPLPGAAVTITFSGSLGGQNVPSASASGAGLTGGTTPAATIAVTTEGFGQYDAQSGWVDLGATKGGIRILRNNAEEAFDVDQIQAEIMSQPTSWEMNVATQLAQVDLETIQLAWEGGTIYTDGTTLERHLPLGTPTSYKERRVAVGFQRSPVGSQTAGLIQFYCFRRSTRSPQESAMSFNKTGDQQSIPMQWRILADSTVQDINARFGEIIDQA